ncbi:nuclear transport factor 2 family protein [Mycobacterium sp.]|uniref:nuclear transport factor 2 family protein n=1 Tax=Mycobacterium sp. TaxID=1785 RepID=UPI002C692E1F|nr:nuclear transport factor 2 family protein [Mycobacterium sp.]HTY34040.1 nuclear transport factor 2 family protein [Mycobacterium sp.]
MSDSPESLVRKFFAAWTDPQPEKLGGFFHADAVWVDGPQGVRRGVDAIKSELATQLKAVGGAQVEVRLLFSEGSTVMVEQVSNSDLCGNSPLRPPRLFWGRVSHDHEPYRLLDC